MRLAFITIAFIFIFLGILFIILPLEKYGLIAAILALIFGLLSHRISNFENSGLPKYLSMIAMVTLFVATYFSFFTKNEVVVIDKQFEHQKLESEKQDQKDLEDLN